VGILQYTTDNILIAKSVDPRVAGSRVSLQSVGPQASALRAHTAICEKRCFNMLIPSQAVSGLGASITHFILSVCQHVNTTHVLCMASREAYDGERFFGCAFHPSLYHLLFYSLSSSSFPNVVRSTRPGAEPGHAT
jgi:hypothetical protein